MCSPNESVREEMYYGKSGLAHMWNQRIKGVSVPYNLCSIRCGGMLLEVCTDILIAY